MKSGRFGCKTSALYQAASVPQKALATPVWPSTVITFFRVKLHVSPSANLAKQATGYGPFLIAVTKAPYTSFLAIVLLPKYFKPDRFPGILVNDSRVAVFQVSAWKFPFVYHTLLTDGVFDIGLLEPKIPFYLFICQHLYNMGIFPPLLVKGVWYLICHQALCYLPGTVTIQILLIDPPYDFGLVLPDDKIFVFIFFVGQEFARCD